MKDGVRVHIHHKEFQGMLKRYGNIDYYLGTTTSIDDSNPKWFEGDIVDVKME